MEQKLGNKGNYVGNLTGKIQEQRLQDNGTRGSFASFGSSYSPFVETLGSHLNGVFQIPEVRDNRGKITVLHWSIFSGLRLKFELR